MENCGLLRTVENFIDLFNSSVGCVQFGPNSEVTFYRICIWFEFKLPNCEFGPAYIICNHKVEPRVEQEKFHIFAGCAGDLSPPGRREDARQIQFGGYFEILLTYPDFRNHY
jgi:hypothetical protein